MSAAAELQHLLDAQPKPDCAALALGECKGEATIIRAGKQLVFLEARLWGADSRLAVHATATVAVPAR